MRNNLRIFENGLNSEETDTNLDNFIVSVWCVIITMTTVGFGDYYLRPHPRYFGIVILLRIDLFSIRHLGTSTRRCIHGSIRHIKSFVSSK